MKKLLCLIAALTITTVTAITNFTGAAFTKAEAAATSLDKNMALIVTACEQNGENGFAAVAGEGTEISFDMLKTADNGKTGIVSAADKKSVSKNAASVEYSFESGYNYRLTLSGDKVKISRKGFFENSYRQIAEKSVSAGKVLGVYGLSDGVLSASFIIDNFICHDENGNETVVDRFEKKTAEKGSLIKSFDCNGYIDVFDDVTYNVSFLTKDGDLIATQTVCKYNYVTLPAAPKKEGYRFVRWVGDTENITADGVCYAEYEEGEEPSSESGTSASDSVNGSDNDSDNGGSGRGCGSAVTGVSVAALAACFVAAVIIKRRNENE